MLYKEVNGAVSLHPLGCSNTDSISLTWPEVREIAPEWDSLSVEDRTTALEAWYWD